MRDSIQGILERVENLESLLADVSRHDSELQMLLRTIEQVSGKSLEEIEEDRRLRAVQALSQEDRRKVVELTEFYKHLSQIVENLIDKFSMQERLVTSLHLQSNKETRNKQSKTLLPSIPQSRRTSSDQQQTDRLSNT